MRTCKTIPLPQPDKPNQQVREYLDAFGKGGRLVMYSETGWRIVRPNDQKSSEFATKEEAVAVAERELIKDKGDLFIFDENGQLLSCQQSPRGIHGCIKRLLQNIRLG